MMLKWKYRISRADLKLIALVAMVLDHIAAILLENRIEMGCYDIISGDFFVQQTVAMKMICYLYVIFRNIGRISFPMFCFLLIDGLERTSNYKKWLLRLFIFGVVSEIPYSLSFFGKCLNNRIHNVFFTLSLGMSLIIILSKTEKERMSFGWCYFLLILINIFLLTSKGTNRKDYLFILCLCGLLVIIYIVNDITVVNILKKFLIIFLFTQICVLLKCEYSYSAMLIIVCYYYLRNKKLFSSIVSVFVLICLERFELFSVISVVFIYAYDETIRSKNLKYLFYLFYPIHLMVLYVANNLIN